MKYVLITAAVAKRQQAPVYMRRGEQHKFHALIASEEEAWEAEQQLKRAKKEQQQQHRGPMEAQAQSFEEYRQNAVAA